MSNITIPDIVRSDPSAKAVVEIDPFGGALKGSPEVIVPKADLIVAWAFLERLVVSLRKIGGEYSTPDAQTPLEPERRRQMLEDLDRFIDAQFCKDATRARRALANHLPDGDEAERIADALTLFEPTRNSNVQPQPTH